MAGVREERWAGWWWFEGGFWGFRRGCGGGSSDRTGTWSECLGVEELEEEG